MTPLLSIIIANYNYGRFLGMAIKSIIEQNAFCQCELIVVDGGSTDCSVDVIKTYAKKIAWWTSEKDGGQSDAFNKGFARAKGQFLTWLNADDIMVPNSLQIICKNLRRHPECDWFTGNFFRFINGSNKVTEIGWGPNFYPRVLQRRSSPLVVFGPTSIFSRRIYNMIGPMNIGLHYVMDTDLWIRFIVSGVKQIRIRGFCWGFRIHDESKTEGEAQKRMLEEKLGSERRAVAEAAGYHCSSALCWLLKFWRILDGSYLRALYYRLRFLNCSYKKMGG